MGQVKHRVYTKAQIDAYENRGKTKKPTRKKVATQTTSISFPNMFDLARNKVGVLTNNESVVNRSRLLILTEPTELYNEPNQGVGLKRHLWQYNTENQKAIIKDRIVEQLRLHEPCSVPDNTQFADGLLFTGGDSLSIVEQNYNELNMTVSIQTTFGGTVEINSDSLGGSNNG